MNIEKLNEGLKQFIEGYNDCISIQELEHVGAWDIIKPFIQYDEETNEYYMDGSTFRDMIEEIKENIDEYPKEALDNIKEGFIEYYDKLMDKTLDYVCFLNEV